MVANNKDVVIAFKGRVDPSLQAAARQSERTAVGLRDSLGRKNAAVVQGFGQGLGGRFGTGISAGLAGGFAGAGAFGIAALSNKFLHLSGITEQVARSFGIITEQSKALADSMNAAVKAVRDETHKRVQAALAPSEKARQELFGSLALPAGFPTSLFGGRTGPVAAAMQGIAAERQRLQREREIIPPGSIQAKFMAEELKRIEAGRTFSQRALHWSTLTADSFTGLFGITKGNEGMRLLEQQELRRARRSAQDRAADEAGRRNESLTRAEQELGRREQQLRAFGMLQAGIAGFGIRGRIAGQGMAGMASGVGGLFSRIFGGTFGGIAEGMAMNRAMRLQTESPAETLRRELGNLEEQRRQGLSQENYIRRRRQLLMGGIAGLQEQPFMPLSATESRTLTRGPDQKPEDKLARILREESEKEQKGLRLILEELQRRDVLEVVER